MHATWLTITSSSIWYPNNIQWPVQIIKNILMQICPVSYYFPPLIPQNLPQHYILKHPLFFLRCYRPCATPTHSGKHNYTIFCILSCSRHGVATLWLPSERPGRVLPVSKTFTVLAVHSQLQELWMFSELQGTAFNITHFESRITHLLYTAINTTEQVSQCLGFTKSLTSSIQRLGDVLHDNQGIAAISQVHLPWRDVQCPA